MNKEEILKITKKFHDTYEKLSKEYDYETRKETRVFDINSSNGKLMYATVNEVIKPILEENYELKLQLKGTTHCFDEEEHEKLKKQLEDYKKLGFKHLQDKNNNLETQQKEFISYLEDKIYSIEPKGTGINYNCEYDSEEDYVNAMKEQSKLNTLKEILQKYKEIMGDINDKK